MEKLWKSYEKVKIKNKYIFNFKNLITFFMNNFLKFKIFVLNLK